MITRSEFLSYLDTLLEPNRFQDYCPNGLQVEVMITLNIGVR